jgi:hypothetical protein
MRSKSNIINCLERAFAQDRVFDDRQPFILMGWRHCASLGNTQDSAQLVDPKAVLYATAQNKFY